MQNRGGAVGSWFFAHADRGQRAFFTRYLPWANEIRRIYGRLTLQKEDIKPIIKNLSKELTLTSLGISVGNIPFVAFRRT